MSARLTDRQDHAVDHVNDAVGLVHVGGGHGGCAPILVIDFQFVAVHVDGEHAAADGLNHVLAAVMPDHWSGVVWLNILAIGLSSGAGYLMWFHAISIALCLLIPGPSRK